MSRPDHTPDDAYLLRAFTRRGDENAFRQLAERYAGLVYGVALRRAPHAADEVTQDTFLTLARKAGSLDASAGLGAWLHTVATRAACNAGRKETHRRQTMAALCDQHLTAAAVDVTPPEALLAELDEGLAALTDSDRRLLLLRYFESLSYAEIGRALATSEEASRKRVTRALGKLSRALGRRGVAVPAVSLAAALGTALATDAPAATVSLAARTATASAGATSTAVAATTLTAMKTPSLTAAAAALLIATSLPVALQWRVAHAARTAAGEAGAPLPAPDGIPPPSDAAAAADTWTRRPGGGGFDLAALAAALAEVRGGGGDGDLARILDLQAQMYGLQPAQFADVAALLAGAPNRDAIVPVIDAFFCRWAEEDPRAALGETLATRWGHHTGNARVQASQVWAATDPEAAVDWCESQPSDLIGSILKMCVFRHWAVRDPEAALGRTGRLPADRRASYRSELLSVWAGYAPREALAWAGSVEDEAERSALIEGTLEAAAQADSATAFDLALALDDPILSTSALRYALMQWTNTDEAAAARAFLALPDAKRTAALAGYLEQLLVDDPPSGPHDHEAAIRDWLEAREEGGGR